MSKRQRTRYLKRVVIYCVAMGSAVTLIYLWRGDLTASGIAALLAFWGGELLTTALIKLLGDGGSSAAKKTDPDVTDAGPTI